MKILITAPSLNTEKNVSGISAVVQAIKKHNKEHIYFHYLLGRPNTYLSKVDWFLKVVKQLVYFPMVLIKQKVDLVHQNLPFDPKGLLRESIINFWANLCNVPVFLHIHGGAFLMNGTSNKFYRFLAQQLFKHSKIVVVLSELEKEALAKQYQYDGAKILMNSVDSKLYSSLRKEKEDKPTLLFLGRIHESKGVEDIIEAFRILKAEIDFRFILCGQGPLRELVISKCAEILGEDFDYRGVVSGNEKLKAIADADFFLLPSRYGEGLPIALLETMAAGVVPVVTDDASMKYVVQSRGNGIRVNKSDAFNLKEELKMAILDNKLYTKLSENAKSTIAANYDIKTYISKLNQMYHLK